MTIIESGAIRMVPAKQQQMQQQQHSSEHNQPHHDASIARRWAEDVIDSVLQQAARSASDISFAAAAEANTAAEAAAKATPAVAEAAAAMSAGDESSKSLPSSLSSSGIQTTHPTATPVIRSAAAAPEIGS